VKDAGFEGIPEGHIYDRFGIPKPQAGEKTLRLRQPGGPGDDAPDVEKTAHKADPTDGIDSLITAQRYVDTLADDALSQGAIDMSAVERIVEEAESFEDLQARLAEVYAGIGMDGFRRVLAEAMVRADLKGRSLV
jgi:phage gp29-like protein